VADLAAHLLTLPEVGAVQTYVDGDHPALRTDEMANIRLQLRTGDNVAMQSVVDATTEHLAARPVPGVALDWAGEAYLNLTWQQKMVSGMLVGFAVTLVVVFGLLVVLFRSLRWAVLAMTPVLWTILIVYGAMAMLGRDVDMPVAVLSTMVLGIGVDFAIHFVARYRTLLADLGPAQALEEFFGEPARAMTRNAVVIAVGFSPLLLSSLVPYVVVGVLLASIVSLSWLASIVALPAVVGRGSRRGQELSTAGPRPDHAPEGVDSRQPLAVGR
jgi:predicted RND superfamily exporter protein